MEAVATKPAPTAATEPPLNIEPPLRIGSRTMPSRYALAPLAGYTQLAFRRAIRELGGLGLATTDLVHSRMLIGERPKSMQLVATSEDDTPLSVQLFGSKPHEIATAAKWLEDRGYAGIDLNMGCPMAKVTGEGGGARLMCDAGGATRLVATVLGATRLPVTVKMRLGWDTANRTSPALAREFAEMGVAAVTIHGRTRQQGFGGTVDLDGITETVAAAPSIPVIGNGDVRSAADARAMRRRTGCAAVAIGRGAMLDPWIFRRLDDPAFDGPNDEDRIAFLRRHVRLMIAQHDEYGCVLVRKFAAWYGAVLGLSLDIEDRLRRLDTAEQFEQLANEAAETPTQPRPATALVRVPNGPVERW